MAFIDELMKLKDDEYAEFTAKLTPNVDKNKFIGVRVPEARKLAKRLAKEDPQGVEAFFAALPHATFDENMLHGLLISEMKDYNQCVQRVDDFLPYVDNWAVCDIMSPKVFKKNLESFMSEILKWAASEQVYTSRFALGMLMSFYLDDEFKPEYLEIPAGVTGEDYYIKMMVAWFYATALAKQWDATIPYIEEGRLEKWTHNKTIQKARESYRITSEQKEYLKSLKK